MNPRTNQALRFLQSWVINTVAVLVAVMLLGGRISYQGWESLVVASLLLGILNAFVRPVLMRLMLPLVIFTLGLFTLVINALVLSLIGWLMQPHFQVNSFGSAFLGALIISAISITLNLLTGNSRIKVQRQRPPNPPGNSGGGPVIDV